MSMLKKLIAVLLVFALVFTTFAACGRGGSTKSDDDKKVTSSNKDKSDKDDNKDKKDNKDSKKADTRDEDEPKKSGDEGSKKDGSKISYESGEELNSFYDAFNEAMGRFESAASNFDSNDFNLMLNIEMDQAVIYLDIVHMTMVDFISLADKDRETGKIGDYDTVKERNGSKLTYTMHAVNEEDGFDPTDLAGDEKTIAGELDMKNDAYMQESVIKRDGAVISRSVTEIVRLPDGSFLAQYFYVPKKPEDSRREHKGTVYFYHCKKDKLEIIVAKFEPDFAFSYKSIVGDPGASIESMAAGYQKVREYVFTEDEIILAENYE
ncbi:MAG TPA: hypothetical protein GX501_06770 [Clostridiaceae bacterium]|nr:hypothetical protein [Clostridiaceae bacterium]